MLIRSILILSITASLLVAGDGLPQTEKEGKALTEELARQLTQLNQRLHEEPQNVSLYSRRGDVRFFRGEFKEAVQDYEKMVELDPSLETSHWRRGIAYFYAERYKDAARQFEIYHTFDDVDRENGIWRYLSQAKAYGLEKAREGLLKYGKDDREPFPDVYRLFAGKATGEEIIRRITAAEISDDDREKRLFYARLYIGLNEFIEGRDRSALEHLRKAVANRRGREAGYGPNYMWHVARVHREMLERKGSRDQGVEGPRERR